MLIFNERQSKEIKERTNGRELTRIRLVRNKVEYTFNDGTVLHSVTLTKERFSWMMLQQGTEREYIELIYNLLLDELK